MSNEQKGLIIAIPVDAPPRMSQAFYSLVKCATQKGDTRVVKAVTELFNGQKNPEPKKLHEFFDAIEATPWPEVSAAANEFGEALIECMGSEEDNA